MIDIEELTIDFGRGSDHVRAVQGISFQVQARESFGLVGESGSGKSTVLRALAGLNTEWQGQIRYDGEIVSKKIQLDYHKRVQMVFQDPFGSLHPRQTIDQILREPLAIHRLDDREGRIQRVLDMVRLGPEFRFRFPHQLSGGQRQRVAIARALILEPETLLLDEPTSALDVSIQAEILNLLNELREDLGLTFLLVSHNLGVISHMCDRLAVMQGGRILETADAATLADGSFKTAYAKRLFLASHGYRPAEGNDLATTPIL
ncbi:MAG: ABC transporter ATP-binding protein [Geminicoccales bacterium]